MSARLFYSKFSKNIFYCIITSRNLISNLIKTYCLPYRRVFPQLSLSDEDNNNISAKILEVINQQNIEYYEGRPWAKE